MIDLINFFAKSKKTGQLTNLFLPASVNSSTIWFTASSVVLFFLKPYCFLHETSFDKKKIFYLSHTKDSKNFENGNKRELGLQLLISLFSPDCK